MKLTVCLLVGMVALLGTDHANTTEQPSAPSHSRTREYNPAKLFLPFPADWRLNKMTLHECEDRRGEYEAPSVSQPSDVIDCWLRVPSEWLLHKKTLHDCETSRGEYEPPPMPQQSDIVDCWQRAIVLHDVYTPPLPHPILGSAYDYLYRGGIEKDNYGLYSYVLLPTSGLRSQRLLQELFKTTSFIELIGLGVGQLNVVYLPVRSTALGTLLPMIEHGSAPKLDVFAADIYDYAMAQTFLARICAMPSKSSAAVCRSDLSVGPFIVTYVRPASAVATLPVPFLFLDLSNVHQQAFGEFIAAYKEQVKGPDFSARDRVDNLRLRLLNVVLTSSDWLKPLVRESHAIVVEN